MLSPTRIRWLSLSGYVTETAGHLRAQNRITLLLCTFEGEALIVRGCGSAKVIHPRDADWGKAIAAFPEFSDTRQIFDVTVESVQTSCSTDVPEMAFARDRVPEELAPFYADMGPTGVDACRRKKNTETIDGLPTGIFQD